MRYKLSPALRFLIIYRLSVKLYMPTFFQRNRYLTLFFHQRQWLFAWSFYTNKIKNDCHKKKMNRCTSMSIFDVPHSDKFQEWRPLLQGHYHPNSQLNIKQSCRFILHKSMLLIYLGYTFYQQGHVKQLNQAIYWLHINLFFTNRYRISKTLASFDNHHFLGIQNNEFSK